MSEKHTDAPLLGSRWERALVLANEWHRTQQRKGTDIPYVAHLLSVAALVLEMGGREDEAVAALLHDAIEDAGDPSEVRRVIADELGPEVLRIVEANSDTDEHPKPPWRERKESYIAAIATKEPDELRVSLADKLHNARAILLDFRTHGDDLWSRFRAGGGPAVRWYYRTLAEAFEARSADLGDQAAPVLGELRRTVDAIDELAEGADPRSA